MTQQPPGQPTHQTPMYSGSPQYQGPPVTPSPQYQPVNQAPAPYAYGAPDASAGKGFFGTLFDVSFEHFATRKIVRVFYILMLIGVCGGTIFSFLAGLMLMSEEPTGVLIVFAAPLVGLLTLMWIRLMLEICAVLYTTAEHLRVIRRQGENM